MEQEELQDAPWVNQEPENTEALEDAPWASTPAPGEEWRGTEEDPLQGFAQTTAKISEQHEMEQKSIDKNEDSVVGPDVYEGITENPEYQSLREWDDYWGGPEKGRAAINSIDNLPDTMFGPEGKFKTTKKELKQKYKEQQGKKEDLYSKVGKEDTFLGQDVRIQTRNEPNIDFDPSAPATEENSEYTKREYFVPKPDQNALVRIGYNVARSLAGLAEIPVDLATEGEVNITKPGALRSNMPEMPSTGSEEFISELAAFAIGPGLAAKAVEKVAQGARSGAALSGSLAARSLEYLSPTALERTRVIYQTALQKGATAAQATERARNYMKKAVVGLSIGLSEAAVSDDDATGLLPPSIFEEMGMNPRDARDTALILDSPVVNRTLSILGTGYNKGRDIATNTLGGLRTLNPKMMRNLSEREAGVKLLTLLDPQLLQDSPELVGVKVKILSDNLDQFAERQVTLGNASTEIKQDTAGAMVQSSENYFRQSYAHLEDAMGPKEFNDWVSANARDMSSKILALRTAMLKSPEVSDKMAVQSATLRELYQDAAEKETTSGSLTGTLDTAADTLATERTDILTGNEDRLTRSREGFEKAKTNLEQGFKSDPEVAKLISLAETEFALGSNTKINSQIQSVLGDKMYGNFKRMYDDYSSKYNAISANKDIQLDEVAFFTKLKSMGDEEGNFADPVFRKIGSIVSEDPSYGNAVTEVHNIINRRIRELTSKPGQDDYVIDNLRALDNHIMAEQADLIEGGVPEVTAALQDAKNSYIKYKTAWEDNADLRRVAPIGKNRANAERVELPAGVTPRGQGVNEWEQGMRDVYEQRIDDPSGKYQEALTTAARAGGDPIDDDLRSIVELQTAKKLSERVVTGEQGVRTFRTDLRGTIENLERFKSPYVQKYKELDKKLQTLENTVKNKEELFKLQKEAYDQVNADVNDSVIANFSVRSEGKKNTFEPVGNPQAAMDRLFTGPSSTNDIQKLLKKADDLGERGTPIKEALRGSYLNYLKRKTFSAAELGLAKVDNGKLVMGKDVSKRTMDNFIEDSSIKKNLSILYGDNMVKQLEDLNTTIDLATKRLNMGEQIDRRLRSDEDAQKAITSAITITLGVLNPTATKIKRFANPFGEMAIEDVKNVKNAILIAAINDPRYAAKLMAIGPREQISQQQMDEMRKWLVKANINVLKNEKDRDFKVPEGVKSKRADSLRETKGLLEKGNIDLAKRPKVKNSDGTISTVRSMSFEEDGIEILVPTISDDGKTLSEDEAIENYHKTGKFLGKFKTPEAATDYAKKLHQDQEKLYSK